MKNSGMKNLTRLWAVPEIAEILDHEAFRSMKYFRHHGRVSCRDHSIQVALRAFGMAERLGADRVAAARAALLHDFYLYDWHTSGPGLHGFRHPSIALANAQRHFRLSRVERDAIRRHMWPLTAVPPRYRESIIVSLADKAVTLTDYLRSVRALFQVQKKRLGQKHGHGYDQGDDRDRNSRLEELAEADGNALLAG